MPDFEADDGFISQDQGTIYDYEASLGEYAGAAFQRQMDTNPLQFILREGAFLSEDFQSIAGYAERVDAKSAREEVARRGLKLDIPDGGITRYELDALQYLKQREINQTTTMARRSGALTTAAGFAAGLAAGATDPLNVASAFIPVVKEARYAAWLAKTESFAGRAAIRAGVGATEGAVGAALIEPIVYAGATAEQFDYTGADSFLNVMFGTVLGGGLHVAGGAISDASRLRALAGVAPEPAQLQALQGAVRALEDELPVRAEQDFAAHYGLTDSDFLRQSYDFSPRQMDEARSAVVMARGGEDAKGPQTLFQAIRALGGIKVRDATGQLTREGAEIMAVLGDTRLPGLINNRRGVTPDYLREALTEDGWFRFKDTTETELQELYDAIEAAARGGEVARVGEARGPKLQAAAARELAEAGVKASDTAAKATMKVAEHRAKVQRERMQDDPDFEPTEIIYREPGDEDELAGPVTDEILSRFEQFAAPSPRSQRGLSDLIATARQERTADAFNRQFVDDPADVEASRQADEAVAKSEDVARVVEDTAFLDAQINGLKSREMWTKADDAALEAGEMKAAELERAASIYRAAAVCMAE